MQTNVAMYNRHAIKTLSVERSARYMKLMARCEQECFAYDVQMEQLSQGEWSSWCETHHGRYWAEHLKMLKVLSDPNYIEILEKESDLDSQQGVSHIDQEIVKMNLGDDACQKEKEVHECGQEVVREHGLVVPEEEGKKVCQRDHVKDLEVRMSLMEMHQGQYCNGGASYDPMVELEEYSYQSELRQVTRRLAIPHDGDHKANLREVNQGLIKNSSIGNYGMTVPDYFAKTQLVGWDKGQVLVSRNGLVLSESFIVGSMSQWPTQEVMTRPYRCYHYRQLIVSYVPENVGVKGQIMFDFCLVPTQVRVHKYDVDKSFSFEVNCGPVVGLTLRGERSQYLPIVNTYLSDVSEEGVVIGTFYYSYRVDLWTPCYQCDSQEDLVNQFKCELKRFESMYPVLTWLNGQIQKGLVQVGILWPGYQGANARVERRIYYYANSRLMFSWPLKQMCDRYELTGSEILLMCVAETVCRFHGEGDGRPIKLTEVSAIMKAMLLNMKQKGELRSDDEGLLTYLNLYDFWVDKHYDVSVRLKEKM